ncbi:hypothetical protein H8F21_14230 [Pseudomonas sp. P66]|uniref:Uncharacterized protein n=1 Tax=Pseudomonas arcuscaelestis TaxID=2710591 RepID=A0ABS2BYN7_9PSED|nr:hypothetical protein [Pseudomonas arcuscaelestis]MBM5458722.1 hypothetical protein [Pseudomonas arcuscaelestis]
MTAQLHRIAARGFTETNLTSLARDVLVWRKNAVLPEDCKLHELANLCVPFASIGDEYQEAERMIVSFALENAARSAASSADQVMRDLLSKARKSVDYQRGMQNTNHPAGQAHAAEFKLLLEQIDVALAATTTAQPAG